MIQGATPGGVTIFMPGQALENNYGMTCCCNIVKDLINACNIVQGLDSNLYLMKMHDFLFKNTNLSESADHCLHQLSHMCGKHACDVLQFLSNQIANCPP